MRSVEVVVRDRVRSALGMIGLFALTSPSVRTLLESLPSRARLIELVGNEADPRSARRCYGRASGYFDATVACPEVT